VVEEIPLPLDLQSPRRELLPFGNYRAGFDTLGKGCKGVQMVGHQEEELHPPITALIPKRN
jgi:hypothetical protein